MQDSKGIIIGGGTMGADIASIFTAHGLDVEIVESNAEVRERLEENVLASAHEIGCGDVIGRVKSVPEIRNLDWDRARLVIECVTESLELKQTVFRELEQAAPKDLPLTSNSSGFPITRIAEGLSTAWRMVGLHFFMPAHLVPCVEVIIGERTDPDVASDVHAAMGALGKKPVRVNKDIPGFLGNRIQAALLRETLSLLDGGYASAEDLDTVVQYSFGFRFVAAGPLLQKDISGSASIYTSASTIYPTLDNRDAPGSTLTRLHAEKKWGMKAKEGFYCWADDEIETTKKRYTHALREALRILHEQH